MLETKLSILGFQKLKMQQFQHLHVAQRDNPEGRSRILLIWDDQKVNMDVCDWHDQYAHCLVTCKISYRVFAIIFVYRQLTIVGRKTLCERLHNIAIDIGHPWLVLGYFNTFLSPADKCGGIPVTQSSISDFQTFVSSASLKDITYTGCRYTWTNGYICSKLDRVMVNNLGRKRIYIALQI